GVALGIAHGPEPEGDYLNTAQVEQLGTPEDITSPDPGPDPSLGINFKGLPLAEMSVPGVADPTQPPGLPAAPEEAARMTVPPPRGLGAGPGGGRKGGPGNASWVDQPGGGTDRASLSASRAVSGLPASRSRWRAATRSRKPPSPAGCCGWRCTRPTTA